MGGGNRTALKEWASVIEALKTGGQVLLLRKGGIAEKGREFRVEEREFSLYPTFLHQDKQYLRPEFHAIFDRVLTEAAAAGRVRIDSYAIVEQVIQATDLPRLHRLEPFHIWTPAYIDLRYQYKPETPLCVLLLRVHRMPRPVECEETIAYRGCKSWVRMDFEIDTAGCTPVLSDQAFTERTRAVRDTLQA